MKYYFIKISVKLKDVPKTKTDIFFFIRYSVQQYIVIVIDQTINGE